MLRILIAVACLGWLAYRAIRREQRNQLTIVEQKNAAWSGMPKRYRVTQP